MAKNKATKSDIKNKTIDELLSDYAKLCGNQEKADHLKNKFSDAEIRIFIHEIVSHRDFLDSDHLFDFDTLEQLANIKIEMDRILKFQRDRMKDAEALKDSEDQGAKEMAMTYEGEALQLTKEYNELNTKFERMLKGLSQLREQRLKRSSETRVTLTNIIAELDDSYTKDRLGKYGELLKKAANKKRASMVNDGLIIVAKEGIISITNESELEVGQAK